MGKGMPATVLRLRADLATCDKRGSMWAAPVPILRRESSNPVPFRVSGALPFMAALGRHVLQGYITDSLKESLQRVTKGLGECVQSV